MPDPTRAPDGGHIFWAYVHVPHGSDVDMTEAIENQVERFAPGFRDTVVERVTKNAVQMEQWNPNHVGGDISNGEASFTQMLARPVPRWNTYKTPVRGTYLASAATPPGPGRARPVRGQRRPGGPARGVRRPEGSRALRPGAPADAWRSRFGR